MKSLAYFPSRNRAEDDLKSVAGEIHQLLRRRLQLTQSGSNYEAFAKAYLVPLVTHETNAYDELRSSIWPDPSGTSESDPPASVAVAT